MTASSSIVMDDADSDSALRYALERLGRPSLTLKPEQIRAIKSVLVGNDTFVWLPTGFGKSICFEALPYVYDYKLGNKDRDLRSLVLVISPLISLMVNQVVTLKSYGVSAAVVSHGKGVQKDVIASSEDGAKYNLLFCSPEALVSSKWRELLQQPGIHGRIVAIVVDEAHCVSKWYDI